MLVVRWKVAFGVPPLTTATGTPCTPKRGLCRMLRGRIDIVYSADNEADKDVRTLTSAYRMSIDLRQISMKNQPSNC